MRWLVVIVAVAALAAPAFAQVQAPDPASEPGFVDARIDIKTRQMPHRKGIRIAGFRVTAPAGATIDVACPYDACPMRRYAATGEPISVTTMIGRRIRNGLGWIVVVTDPHDIGFGNAYLVRRGITLAPARTCLSPGGTEGVDCPADAPPPKAARAMR